jgi:hypothetical protein
LFGLKTTIYSIDLLTMANKVNPTETLNMDGYRFHRHFSQAIQIDNRVVNGHKSTRSFISEKRWDSVCKTLKKEIMFCSIWSQ